MENTGQGSETKNAAKKPKNNPSTRLKKLKEDKPKPKKNQAQASLKNAEIEVFIEDRAEFNAGTEISSEIPKTPRLPLISNLTIPAEIPYTQNESITIFAELLPHS
mgnify:FL=1